MAQLTPLRNNEVLKELTIDTQEIEKRKKTVDFSGEDMKRIASIKGLIISHADKFVETFFDFLRDHEEARNIFTDTRVLEEAKTLKRDHILALADGEYGQHYVDQRLRLGRLYSKSGLGTRVFLAAYNHLMQTIGELIIQKGRSAPEEAFKNFTALKKIACFDLGLIVDVIVLDRERTIRQQQEAIKELSTPVLQLHDRLLMLPIVGMIDTHRAKLLTESLLRSIRSARAKAVVIDITGVAAVDSRVANHLVQTVSACGLMGAKVIVTGLSAEVAQTLVTLGVDLHKLNTVGDLQGGIEEAEKIIGRMAAVDNRGPQSVEYAGPNPMTV